MTKYYTLICCKCGCDVVQVPITFTTAFLKTCDMMVKTECPNCDKETLHTFKKEN